MGGWLGLSAVGAHQRAGLDGVKGDGGARGTSHKPRRRPARAHPRRKSWILRKRTESGQTGRAQRGRPVGAIGSGGASKSCGV